MPVCSGNRRNLSTGGGLQDAIARLVGAYRATSWLFRDLGRVPMVGFVVGGEWCADFCPANCHTGCFSGTCSKRAQTSDWRWRSGVDHRSRGHTDADFGTPIGDPRWIERRNIAPKCRLPKPAILRTIDAPGRRLEGRVVWAQGDTDSRPAGCRGIRRTVSTRPAGVQRRTPRTCPVWQVDLAQQPRWRLAERYGQAVIRW